MLQRFEVPVVTGGAAVPHAPVHIADAFAAARIYHQKRNRCAIGEKYLEAELAQLEDCLPQKFNSGNDKQTFEVDQQQLLWVLEHGFDAALIEIAEIRDMKSSIRGFTLPSQTPFGVFARKDIATGTILYTVRCAPVRLGVSRMHKQVRRFDLRRALSVSCPCLFSTLAW